jgi:hypothetical protein
MTAGPEGRTAAPSALDDWTTVWASWTHRAPLVWAAALAFVAAVAVAGDAPQAPLFVAAAAAVAASCVSWTVSSRWSEALVLALAVVAPPLCASVSPDSEDAVQYAVAAVAGVASLLAARARVPPGPAAFAALAGAAAAAAVLLSRGSALDLDSPALAVLAPLLVLAARAGPWTGWISAGLSVGVVALATAEATPLVVARPAWVEPLSTAGLALGVVVLVRAALRTRPAADEADAAAARWVVRLARRPWTTTLIACTVASALEPAFCGVTVLVPPLPALLFLPAISVGVLAVSVLAVAERTIWASARVLVGGVAAAAASWAVSTAVRPVATPAWVPLLVPVAVSLQLGIAWLCVRAAPVERPSAAISILAWLGAAAFVAAACVRASGLTHVDVALSLTILAVLLWIVVLLRLARTAITPRAATAAWMASTVLVGLATAVFGALARDDAADEDPMVFLLGMDRQGLWAIAAASPLAALHGAFALAVLRRLRNVCVVPEGHALVRDWGVDLRCAAVAVAAAQTPPVALGGTS